jgi:hypothetical protein
MARIAGSWCGVSISDEDDVDDDSPVESGPYCPHYHEPGDYEEPCDRCQHPCREHSYYSGRCEVEGCECEEIEVKR